MDRLVCHRCGHAPNPGQVESRCPNDGLFLVEEAEHERAVTDRHLGRILGGRFPLLGVLGEGAMGAVYRSRPLPDGPEVAVKLVHGAPRGMSPKVTAQLEQRFLREAQLLAQVNHPAVVSVIESGTEADGLLYMVMERLRGRPLSAVLPELRPEHLVRLLLQVLDALAQAHDQGLVHRDIKPDNLMVLDGDPLPDGSPRIKLLDFGIAKSLRDRPQNRLTQEGTVFGTPEYMAPEQAIGTPDVDHRVDLYAVGVVLFEGLVGRPPFEAPSPLAVLHKVVSERAPPIPDSAGISDALRAVVDRALRKAPAERFTGARAMAAALAAAPEGAPPQPSPPQAQPTTGLSDVGQTSVDMPALRLGPALLAKAGLAEPDPTPLESQPTPSPEPHPPAALAMAARLTEPRLSPARPLDPATVTVPGRGWRWAVILAAVALAGGAAAWALQPSGPAIEPNLEPVRISVTIARRDAGPEPPEAGPEPPR